MNRRFLFMLIVFLFVPFIAFAAIDEVLSTDYVISYSFENVASHGVRYESDLLDGRPGADWSHGIGLAMTMESPLSEDGFVPVLGTLLTGYKYTSMHFEPLELSVLAGPAFLLDLESPGYGMGFAFDAEYYIGSSRVLSFRAGLQAMVGSIYDSVIQTFRTDEAAWNVAAFTGFTLRFRTYNKEGGNV